MIKYFLIPDFIADNLRRKNLALSDLLDFNKMKENFALNDIALLSELQNHWPSLFSSLGKLNYSSNYDLYWLWSQTATGDNREIHSNIVNNVLVESGQAKQEVIERLFTGVTKNDGGDQPAYEIVDMGPKYYGIILSSGAFPNPQVVPLLVRDIIASMYLYYAQHEIARSEFFPLYLKGLNRRMIRPK